MLKNVQLSLMIGPVVPLPVPRDVIEALQAVEVTHNTDAPSGFQLTFSLDSKSTLNTLLLLLPQMGPAVAVVRVIITVVVNGSPTVLMDGMLTHQQVAPDVASGKSTLTLTGKDISAAMDHIEIPGLPFPAMPPEARVLLILAKYAIFGIIPLVIPSLYPDIPIPIESIPGQQGTDYQYVTALAKDVGYVFYVDPGPLPGMNTAYWGPEIKTGVPQRALNLNMGAHTNVESLSLGFDGLANTLPIVLVQNQMTKVTFPIPIPLNPFQPPLGATGLIPTKIEFLKETAKMSPMKAIMTGLAVASASSEAVRGTGTLDVLRYGRLLKSRGLVGVRGAGQAFDGLYFVKSVTHSIKRGEYKQNFTLTRNGLVSLTPTVPA
ncbi:MAG: hypothetical protein ACREMX_02170 [Gemmatimonadales bacterium]